MTLVDALRAVAPPAAAPTGAEMHLRQEALAVIYAELHRMARAKGASRDDAEDAASQIAVAIASAGPREVNACPRSEGQARGYLAAALRNRLIDRYRAVKRLTVAEDLDVFAAPAEQDAPLDTGRLEALMHEAETVLYDQAVPAIARDVAGRFDRDGFVLAIGQLRAIHEEQVTLDALLTAADGRVTATGRNRLYKQHERARTRLLQHLPAWLEQSGQQEPMTTAVRWVVSTQLASRVTSEGES
jgi:DNA-directed RNA polymerase specialized sigma24 family protein